jgi:uncharacterized protein YciI
MKYVLIYQSPEVIDLAVVGEHVVEHRARWATFHSQGSLLMIGPFEDPQDGAMAIFTTREAAEEFAQGDPFVLHGVVANWRINGWNEALTSSLQ